MRTGAAHEHGRIVRALAWGIGFVALAKLAGAAKEIVVAARYGTGDAVDAYLLIFNLLNWPLGVLLSVLPTVLIPLLARLRTQSKPSESEFTQELLGLVLVFGTALALVAWVFFPLIVRASGLSESAADLAEQMVPPLILLLPVGALNIFLATRLLGKGSQLNTLMEGIPALVLAIVLVLSASADPRALIWGTVAGFGAHSIALLARIGFEEKLPRPRFGFRSPPWKTFWKAVAVVGLGQALMSFTVVVDQLMASHIAAGAIAALGYAERVIALIVGVGATVAVRATLPAFSASADDPAALRKFAFYWTKILFACGTAAAVLAWAFAPWLVDVLFNRGAFTDNDVVVVSEVLRYGLVQIPFYFGGVVLTSLIAAQRRYVVLAGVAAACLGVKVLANLALVPALGINGLALATGFMYALAFVARFGAVKIILPAASV